MEIPRTVEEISTDLSTLRPENIGAAVLALPDGERTLLVDALMPTRDELQAHIESLADDPDLGKF